MRIVAGFHMTSLKFKLKNYRSYRDFNLVPRAFPLKNGWGFLHISVERESLSVMLIPHTFRIFEARSSLLPSFLLALPKTRVKWRLSNASQQSQQIKFRGWTFLGVDSSINFRQFQNFSLSTQPELASFAWRFPPPPGKINQKSIVYCIFLKSRQPMRMQNCPQEFIH